MQKWNRATEWGNLSLKLQTHLLIFPHLSWAGNILDVMKWTDAKTCLLNSSLRSQDRGNILNDCEHWGMTDFRERQMAPGTGSKGDFLQLRGLWAGCFHVPNPGGRTELYVLCPLSWEFPRDVITFLSIQTWHCPYWAGPAFPLWYVLIRSYVVFKKQGNHRRFWPTESWKTHEEMWAYEEKFLKGPRSEPACGRGCLELPMGHEINPPTHLQGHMQPGTAANSEGIKKSCRSFGIPVPIWTLMK